MISSRQLTQNEIDRIWEIDRAEVIDGVYYVEDGALVLKPEHYDMDGWPAGEAELYTPLLEASHDHGGWFHALFDGNQIAGVAVLENRPIGKNRDTLQLKFLHVSRAYRGQGLGRRLFELAAAEARRRGAKQMYVSATPSEHTVHFYLRQGCTLASEPDTELFALEPEDIHLVCNLSVD